MVHPPPQTLVMKGGRCFMACHFQAQEERWFTARIHLQQETAHITWEWDGSQPPKLWTPGEGKCLTSCRSMAWGKGQQTLQSIFSNAWISPRGNMGFSPQPQSWGQGRHVTVTKGKGSVSLNFPTENWHGAICFAGPHSSAHNLHKSSSILKWLSVNLRLVAWRLSMSFPPGCVAVPLWPPADYMISKTSWAGAGEPKLWSSRENESWKDITWQEKVN